MDKYLNPQGVEALWASVVEYVGDHDYDLPTMSPTTIGGAKLGDGLALTDGALGIDPEPQESTGEVRGAISSLTAKGWATQDGTPTPESPVPIQVARGRNLLDGSNPAAVDTAGKGVTWTNLGGGWWQANGTATSNTYIYATNDASALTLPAGTYTASAFMEGGGVSSLIRVNAGHWVNGTYTAYGSYGTGTKTFNHDGTGNVQITYHVANGNSASSHRFAIQLELGSTPTPYVPYGHVGVEVRQGSTLISAIPVPLPSKGYAASLPDGTADVLTIDGAGKVEWQSATGMVTFDGSESWSVGGSYASTGGGFWYHNNPDGAVVSLNNKSYCDRLTYGNTGNAVNNSGQTVYGNTAAQIRIHPFTPSGQMTVEQITSWLAQNPVTVLYPLATPVTEQCGYIDWPSIPDGATITCPELDALGVRYLIGNGVSEMAREWYERAKSEYESRILALEQAVAELATS